MEYLNYNTLWQPVFTALGAVTPFPESPQLFQDLTSKFPYLKYLSVWILVMQGAGGFNAQLSVVVTVVLFLLITVLDMVYKANEGYRSY